MKNKNKILAMVAVAAIAGGLLVSMPAAEAGQTWKVYTYLPAANLAGARGLRDIAEAVEKETKGELKLQIHLGGSLPIKTSNITQTVGEGIVQMASDGFFLGNVTIGGVLRLPMLMTNEEEWAKGLEIMKPYLERAFEKKNAVVLAHYRYPLQVAWANKKLTSLADMTKLKMRVTSPEQGEFVKAVGGSPITLSGTEVPTALQRGVVSGVFTASAGGGKIWGDMLTHTYRLGPNYFNSVIVVNKEAYQALSPATQKKLKAIARRVAPTITAQYNDEEDKITATLQAKGMVVTPARADDVANASKKMAAVWESWAKSKGKEHEEALAKVRSALGK